MTEDEGNERRRRMGLPQRLNTSTALLSKVCQYDRAEPGSESGRSRWTLRLTLEMLASQVDPLDFVGPLGWLGGLHKHRDRAV